MGGAAKHNEPQALYSRFQLLEQLLEGSQELRQGLRHGLQGFLQLLLLFRLLVCRLRLLLVFRLHIGLWLLIGDEGADLRSLLHPKPRCGKVSVYLVLLLVLLRRRSVVDAAGPRRVDEGDTAIQRGQPREAGEAGEAGQAEYGGRRRSVVLVRRQVMGEERPLGRVVVLNDVELADFVLDRRSKAESEAGED